LLDFTHSFYVAAFFAVERAQQDAAVWAVNRSLLEDTVGQHLHFSPGDGPTLFLHWANQMVGSAPGRGDTSTRALLSKDLVLSIEPFRLFERIAIQQGLFLFPSKLEISFEENLAGTFELTKPSFTEIDPQDRSIDLRAHPVVKLILPRECHRETLADLKQMNITATALFPGLDGFARSLNFALREFDREQIDWFSENLPTS
jgi:hypothetical protein